MQVVNTHSSTNNAPPWSLSTVLVGFILGFFIAPLVISKLLGSLFHQIQPSSKLLILNLGSYSAWILYFKYLNETYPVDILETLGLKFNHKAMYYITMGLVAGLGIMSIMASLSLLSQFLGLHPQQPYQIFPKQQLEVISFLAVLLAPILEETAFRGFLQPALKRTLTAPIAIIVTASVFALFHSLYYGQWVALAYVFMMGLWLGFLREHTKSTIPGIIGHFINNLLASLAILGLVGH